MDMLSWICPDCGCNCAPTDQECPDCTDLVQAGMLALAGALKSHLGQLPPPPEIPLQSLAPVPPPHILPRPAAAEAPRVDAEPEPVSGSPAPALPRRFGIIDTQMAVAPAAPKPSKPPRRSILPGWVVSLMVATGLSLGGAAVVRHMELTRRADAPRDAIAQPTGLARFVEVTGFRVVDDPQRGSRVQYILVNHSGAAIPSMSLRIAVHSMAAEAGSKPLFTISAVVNGLAPYESREVVATLDNIAAKDIPDWEYLKPDVVSGSQ